MIRKIFRNFTAQALGKAVSLIFSIITTFILTRSLGAAGFGQYTLIVAFVTLLAALGNWGTQIIGVRELSRAKNKGRLFGSLLSLRLILAAAALIFGVLSVLILPTFADIKIPALAALILVFLLTAESSFEIVFQSFFKMEAAALLEIISSFLCLLLTIFFLKSGYKLTSPIIAWIFSKILILIPAFLLSKKIIFEKWLVEKEIVKKIFWQSLPMGTLLIMFSAYDRAVDSLIIKSFLGPTAVGLYGLAYKIYINLVLPAYFFVNTIFPILSKEKKEGVKKTLKLGISLTAVALLFLVPTVIVSGKFIILLIAGEEFLGALPSLKILSFALIFSYLNHLSGFTLVALNRQTTSLKIGTVALVFNFCANLIFIPKFGILAAAAITCATEGLVTILSFSALAKNLHSQS